MGQEFIKSFDNFTILLQRISIRHYVVSLQEAYNLYTTSKMLGCISQTKWRRESKSPKIGEIQQIQNLKLMKRWGSLLSEEIE